jgi:hypothetical protein
MVLTVCGARRHPAIGCAHEDFYRDLSSLLKEQA